MDYSRKWLFRMFTVSFLEFSTPDDLVNIVEENPAFSTRISLALRVMILSIQLVRDGR